MSAFDEMVDRLTYRLRMDPELRMDVAQELRAHLEDSAAEFRQAGYADAEADAQAVKALGDETELTELLWLANRRRIRIRQILKWAVRVTLFPAAAVLILVLIIPFLDIVTLANQPIDGPLTDTRRGVLSFFRGEPTNGLTEEQRFILFGDTRAKTKAEGQKAIADRWPDNPVYYGSYIAYLIAEHSSDQGGGWETKLKNETFINSLLTEFDLGTKVEPDNAAYDFLEAYILIRSSCELTEDPSRTFSTRNEHGKSFTNECFRIQITNPARFERGVAALRHGLPKPRCTLHVMDMLEYRLGLLPPMSGLDDYLCHVHWAMVAPTSVLGGKACWVNKAMAAYALLLADEKKLHEVKEVLGVSDLLIAKIGDQSGDAVELLVAPKMRTITLGHALNAFAILHCPDAAREAQTKLDNHGASMRSLYATRPDLGSSVGSTMGVLDGMLMSAVPGSHRDTAPMRKTEYAALERFLLAVLVTVVLGSALFYAAVSLVDMIRYRKDTEGPKLLFVGWARLSRIILCAVILPLGMYVCYAYLASFNGRQFGLAFVLDRLTVEFFLLAWLILGLLYFLSYTAIRRRAQEAGMPVPPPLSLGRSKSYVTPGVVLGAIAITYIVIEQFHLPEGVFSNSGTQICVAMSLAIAMSLYMGFLTDRVLKVRPPFDHFRRTLTRSLVPIFASAALVLGLVGGVASGYAESAAVRNARLIVFDEVENSNLRLLKEHFTQEHQRLLAEYRQHWGQR